MLQDAHNLLRPESMESLFVMWRVTRDPVYREWGWLMFRAWERFARVITGGYACINSVLQVRLECATGHAWKCTLACTCPPVMKRKTRMGLGEADQFL